MRTHRALILLAIMFASLAAAPRAAAQAPVSEAKRQLIVELITVFNEQTSPERIMDAVLVEMSKIYPQTFESLIDSSPEFTDAEKQAILGQSHASYERFAAKFRKRVLAEVDFRKFQTDLSVPLYDKYFTEKELADLVAFYRTPTGKKSLQVMPELFAESIRLSNELLGPAFTRIAQEAIDEELEELKRQRKRS